MSFSSVCFLTAAATTELSTLSLHDALPISPAVPAAAARPAAARAGRAGAGGSWPFSGPHSFGSRSEEHTSELQSLRHLVCRLLLEKKKNIQPRRTTSYDPAPNTNTSSAREA